MSFTACSAALIDVSDAIKDSGGAGGPMPPRQVRLKLAKLKTVRDCSQVSSVSALSFGDMTAKRIALALTQIVSIPLGVILAWRAFIYYVSVMDW
jgi:hypothetical protein